MKVLNYYRTLNNAKNEVTIRNIEMVELSKNAKEYKSFFIQGSFIIKDRVIITEVVKPTAEWIDTFLDKASNLTEGKQYFAYKRPLEALTEGKKILKTFSL